MRVLKMVEDGKLSPEDGARLLDAIRNRRGRQVPALQGTAGRALRINVLGDDGEKVNLSIPLALARLAVTFLPRSAVQAMETEGITVQVTPIRSKARLGVYEISRDRIVVEGDENCEFSYFVNGVRRGYSKYEAYIPNRSYRPEVKGIPYGSGSAPRHPGEEWHPQSRLHAQRDHGRQTGLEAERAGRGAGCRTVVARRRGAPGSCQGGNQPLPARP